MKRRHRKRNLDTSISQINITNLVDVIMVTLLIYMLIAPIVQHGIDIRLPKSSPLKLSAENPVAVSLSRKGGIYLNNVQVSKIQLRERLKSMAEADPELPVIIRADDDIAYKEIIGVLDIIKGSGVINLGLATRVER